VYCATFAGLGLSLFIAHSLERTRRTLAGHRYELATQKDLAEAQRLEAEEQREKAQALAQDLDAYAHAVAHDLKNPIQVIAGYTDLLGEKLADGLDAEGREFLERTASGCAKMTQIINELLVLASVRKRNEVPRQPLDMAAVVAEARQRLSGMIGERGARVVEPVTWPTASGHAPWVEEVWANYISNAIKYGGDPPRLELGAESNGNGKVHFWVRDNGRGLKPEEIEGLFEEFSRVSDRTSDGHGLGLSIVKRIVERLGGEVSVRSALGEGSTFGFTLPR
jgi:signal transduction histidine kinase